MTDTIAELRELLAKATPGPWETDTERSEGEYGSGPDTTTGYDDFLIGADIGGKWVTLLTTENSTAKLIEEDYDEDYHRAWDAVGEANAKLIVAMRNALPALLDRVEAGEAERDRLATLARANNDLARRHQATIDQLRSRCVTMSDQAEFLLDRLDEFCRDITDDETGAEFYGHVSPAAQRLRDTLQQKADTP